jgi:hypothetical protein
MVTMFLLKCVVLYDWVDLTYDRLFHCYFGLFFNQVTGVGTHTKVHKKAKSTVLYLLAFSTKILLLSIFYLHIITICY